MTKKSNPLPGHVRRKQKMVPKFLTQMPMSFSRYADDVLPELFAIAMLNDAFGYPKGAELSFLVSQELKGLGQMGCPLVSAFGNLGAEQVSDLRKSLDRQGIFNDLSRAFTPINRLLCPTPLSLFEDHQDIDSNQCAKHLETCAGRHLSRYSHPSTSALATLYYSQARIGRIKVANGLQVPDLDAIHNDRGSDAAEHAAASVRTYSLMEIGMFQKEVPSDWPVAFWGRCRRVSACRLWVPSEEENDLP